MDMIGLTTRQSAPKPGLFMSERTLTALMWIEVVVCICFVALRTWVQYRNTKRFYANDYFIFAALLFHLLVASVYQVTIPPMYKLERVAHGLAAPGSDFVSSAEFFLRLQYALLYLIWTTLWCVKFSLLFFFWRLFDSVRSPMKIFWWIVCGITASTWITIIVLQNFACDPTSDFFNGNCKSKRDVYFTNLIFQFCAGTDITGDIFILLIPFPLLSKLQVTPRQKWILVVIFLLPLIPIAFGIIRIVFCSPSTGYVNPIKFQLYSMLENTMAIITACLPSLRLFVRNGTRTRTSNYYDISAAKPNRDFRGSQMGVIPLETAVKTRNGEVRLDGGETFDAASRPLSDNSQEEILEQKAPKGVVMVTKEYKVMEY